MDSLNPIEILLAAQAGCPIGSFGEAPRTFNLPVNGVLKSSSFQMNLTV